MNQKVKELEAVYAKLSVLKCKGLCEDSCGPIAASQAEVERIELLANKNLEVDESLTCSMLKDGKCSVYEVRPLICRLFGQVKKMRCPHGCLPTQWVSDQKAMRLLAQIERIGGPPVSSLKNSK